ncbi:MAG: aspartate kinase [Methanomassiliicoccales archaeon]|nr:aspartate kinase [Methanomassiliicoccales archaeon]
MAAKGWKDTHDERGVGALIKVLKFGGTSVGSAQALDRAINIISNESAKKAVVVSAQSGVTNSLIAWMKDDTQEIDSIISFLETKYFEPVKNKLDETSKQSYENQIRESLLQLRKLLERYRNNLENSLQDAIASWGERLSVIMVSSLLNAHGVDSVPMNAEDAGIVALGVHGNGSADLDATTKNFRKTILPLINCGKTPVITGYYGCGKDGKPITFGRGGSDYSAAVVAYAIAADCLEIWTDVDGFMTADPRIVPNARTIKEMDYGEAGELAYFGAKVLHPRTIEPVRRKKIRLLVKNTFNPEGSGTLIHSLRSPGKTLLRSVAIKSDLSILKIYSSEIAYQPGFVSDLLNAIGEDGVTTYAISTSLSTFAVVIPTSEVPQALKKINELKESRMEKLMVKNNMSLICAVGDNMIDTMGVAARIFQVVEEAQANVELISEGASDIALNFVVPSDRATDVVRMLHDRYIGG